MNAINDISPSSETDFSHDNHKNYLSKLNMAPMPAILHAIRNLDDDDVWRISREIIPHEKLPSYNFLLSIGSANLRTTCIRACLLIFTVTYGRVIPRQFQLEAALETIKGNDSIVIAGTGSGKTLCIVIPLILQPGIICAMISPLKRLQMMQVCVSISGLGWITLYKASRSKNFSNTVYPLLQLMKIHRSQMNCGKWVSGCLEH